MNNVISNILELGLYIIAFVSGNACKVLRVENNLIGVFCELLNWHTIQHRALNTTLGQIDNTPAIEN